MKNYVQLGDRMRRFGDTQILPATHIVDIRVSDAAAPKIGDLIGIDQRWLAISIEPLIDVEGLTWTCGAELAP